MDTSSKHWREALSGELASLVNEPDFGLVADMDGTLSPIVAHADLARITPTNRNLLAELVKVLPLVAVISGRSAEDVQARVGIPGVVYFGNHGLERWVDGRVETLPAVEPYLPALKLAVEELKSIDVFGTWVEDKGVTVSVHYRLAERPDEVKAAYTPVVRDIAFRNGLQFFEGQKVFELRPPVDYDKGSAFRDLVAEYNLKAALYLGDDLTDVAALKMARQLRKKGICDSLGVGVVREGGSDQVAENADLIVQDVSEVEALLSWLLSARKASSA